MNIEPRCPCGGVILADTEDWEIPLCNDCYEVKICKHEFEVLATHADPAEPVEYVSVCKKCGVEETGIK